MMRETERHRMACLHCDSASIVSNDVGITVNLDICSNYIVDINVNSYLLHLLHCAPIS